MVDVSGIEIISDSMEFLFEVIIVNSTDGISGNQVILVFIRQLLLNHARFLTRRERENQVRSVSISPRAFLPTTSDAILSATKSKSLGHAEYDGEFLVQYLFHDFVPEISLSGLKRILGEAVVLIMNSLWQVVFLSHLRFGISIPKRLK